MAFHWLANSSGSPGKAGPMEISSRATTCFIRRSISVTRTESCKLVNGVSVVTVGATDGEIGEIGDGSCFWSAVGSTGGPRIVAGPFPGCGVAPVFGSTADVAAGVGPSTALRAGSTSWRVTAIGSPSSSTLTTTGSRDTVGGGVMTDKRRANISRILVNLGSIVFGTSVITNFTGTFDSLRMVWGTIGCVASFGVAIWIEK